MGKLSDRGCGKPGEWQALREESRSKSGNKGPLVGALERRGTTPVSALRERKEKFLRPSSPTQADGFCQGDCKEGAS